MVRKSVLVGVGRYKLISRKGLFIFNRNGLVSDSSWQRSSTRATRLLDREYFNLHAKSCKIIYVLVEIASTLHQIEVRQTFRSCSKDVSTSISSTNNFVSFFIPRTKCFH